MRTTAVFRLKYTLVLRWAFPRRNSDIPLPGLESPQSKAALPALVLVLTWSCLLVASVFLLSNRWFLLRATQECTGSILAAQTSRFGGHRKPNELTPRCTTSRGHCSLTMEASTHAGGHPAARPSRTHPKLTTEIWPGSDGQCPF